jgi:carboxyl-terminal processing protease
LVVNKLTVKGTVQNVIDLNQFVRSNAVGDLGAIKTTTQKIL